MRIFYSNEIRRPPEIVFPWIADPEKALQWQKNVKGGEIIINRPEVIGTTFTEIIEEDGNALEMRGEIIEYVENELIGFHLQSRIHEFDVFYTVEEINNGTRLAIEAIIKWKFPMNIVRLFARRKMEEGIANQFHSEILELQRILEGR